VRYKARSLGVVFWLWYWPVPVVVLVSHGCLGMEEMMTKGNTYIYTWGSGSLIVYIDQADGGEEKDFAGPPWEPLFIGFTAAHRSISSVELCRRFQQGRRSTC